MRLRIDGGLSTITLVSWDEISGEPGRGPSLPKSALRQALAVDPSLSRSLLALIAHVEQSAWPELGDSYELLLDKLVAQVDRGLVRVRLEPRPLVLSEPALSAPFTEPTPLEALEEVRAWVEVELLGEDDLGIPGARCRISWPSGKSIERRTDRFGLVRVDDLGDLGDCQISFPDLDAEAWTDL